MKFSLLHRMSVSEDLVPVSSSLDAGQGPEEDVSEEEADLFPSGEDNFPSEGGGFVLDAQSLAFVGRDTANARSGPPSIATTLLASEVGSTVGEQRDAFLKSFLFYRDEPSPTIEWGIELSEQGSVEKGRSIFGRKKNRIYVKGVSGVLTTSQIQQGDYLKSINNRKIGPSMNGPRAMERMKECLESDGYLSISTANKELGDDILIHVTVIKPRPDMTYEEMGMVVWYWGYLCVKSIGKDSIFRNTEIKSVDHIVSINNILTQDMKPEQFAHVITRLPYDITLTILRRKQRTTGKFG